MVFLFPLIRSFDCSGKGEAFLLPRTIEKYLLFIENYSFENYACQINGILSVMISLNVLVDSAGETAPTGFFSLFCLLASVSTRTAA